MRRHSISVMLGGMLIVLLAVGAGVPGLRAADSKSPSPAAPVVGSGGPGATKPVPAAAPATAPAAAPAYVFRGVGKSDPFKPFMETNLALKKKQEEELSKRLAKKSGPISPLQKLDIEQFRLVGIAGDQNRRTAIVEDGVAKKYYPLFIGTYIGLNAGRVAAILPDRVIVEEQAEKQTEEQAEKQTKKQAKKAKIRRVTVMLHKEKEEEGKP
jgi:Tfp pilus assembly protein PilP